MNEDLISRRALIETLDVMLVSCENHDLREALKEWAKHVPSVSCSEMPNSSGDLVSRQAVIDIIDKHFNSIPMEQTTEILSVRREIRELPTASVHDSAKDAGWIPCTPETMPKEHEWIGTKRFGTTISDEVYVTLENPKGERITQHLSFQNGTLSNHDQREIDAFFKGSKPIAWRPLPEPYQPEEDVCHDD